MGKIWTKIKMWMARGILIAAVGLFIWGFLWPIRSHIAEAVASQILRVLSQ